MKSGKYYSADVSAIALMRGLVTVAVVLSAPVVAHAEAVSGSEEVSQTPEPTVAKAAAAQPEDANATAVADGSGATAEILVTAERRNARTVETPITITAMSEAQLGNKGVTGVLDLTKVVPGLKLDQYGPSVFPAIRGITTSVSGVGVSSNVAVYLDGFYLPTPTALNFEFPDLENVQVLKGPQGTLFGRNATGGAILLTTKMPSDTPEGQFTLGYGTYNEQIASGYASGPIAKNLTASISGSYRHSDGWTRNVINGQKDGFYDSYNLRGKLKYAATDWLTLSLQAEHMYINDPMSMVYRVEGANATADFVPGAIVTRTHYQTAASIQTVLRKKIDTVYFTAKADLGFATLSSLTGYTRELDKNVFDFDGSSLVEVDFRYDNDIRNLTQELILAGHTGALEWSMGGFYLHQDGKMPLASINEFDFLHDQIKTEAIAAYVDGTYNALPKLYLTAGVRYGHEKKSLDYFDLFLVPDTGSATKSWNSWTPRAAIRYQFDRDTSIYASYSKGFAAGLFSTFSPADPAVDPESLNALEVGFKHSSRAISFDTAGFYYKYKDMQFVSYTVGPNGVVSVLRNVGKASIYGLEASFRASLADWFDINAGGTYLHAKYKDFQGAPRYVPVAGGGYTTIPVDASGNQLIRTPTFTGNAGFNLRQPFLGGEIGLGTNLYIVTKSFNDAANDLKIGGHYLLDVNLSWTSADRNWKVSVTGKNVTNQFFLNYWDPSNSALLVNDGAPRTVRATITRRF